MKTTKKLAALLLVALMLVSLVSCGDSSSGGSGDTIVGSWKYSMNLMDLVKEAMNSQSVDSSQKELYEKMLSAYDGVTMDLILTFNEDKTYKTEVSEESLNDALETIKANLKSILPDLLAEMYNMDSSQIDAAFAAQGTTLDDYIDKMMDQQDISKMAGKSSGKYRTDGDKIYFTKDGEEEDTSNYSVYKLSGDSFTITEVVGSKDSDASETFKDYLLPMEFTRV